MNRTSFEKIKNNRLFQAFVISAIILSAFLVGVSTYNIPPQAIAFIYILDTLITIFFVIEICIRFFAEDKKLHFFKNGWNIFDSLIVIISIMSDFNISQYDEITTSHNGFLTMSVEYGILPVAFLLLSFLYLVFNNLNRNYLFEHIIFAMFLIQNLTYDLMYSPDIAIYFWIVPVYFLKNILRVND